MSVSQQTYTRVAITLHWLIALSIIGLLIIGNMFESLGEMGKNDLRSSLRDLHKATGISVLLLSVIRLGWRFTHKPPALSSDLKPWEKGLAKFTHIAFYVLMIAIPLSGWIWSSATGRGIDMFGLFPWPLIPGLDGLKDLPLRSVHGMMADAMILLIVLHVGGALKHQFLDKDATLARMIPMLRRKDQA